MNGVHPRFAEHRLRSIEFDGVHTWAVFLTSYGQELRVSAALAFLGKTLTEVRRLERPKLRAVSSSSVEGRATTPVSVVPTADASGCALPPADEAERGSRFDSGAGEYGGRVRFASGERGVDPAENTVTAVDGLPEEPAIRRTSKAERERSSLLALGERPETKE